MFGSESTKPHSGNPKFVPFATMFKLEVRSRPEMVECLSQRDLQCISCGGLVTWRIYTIAPEKFDAECPECHTKASGYWDGRLCRKVVADA